MVAASARALASRISPDIRPPDEAETQSFVPNTTKILRELKDKRLGRVRELKEKRLGGTEAPIVLSSPAASTSKLSIAPLGWEIPKPITDVDATVTSSSKRNETKDGADSTVETIRSRIKSRQLRVRAKISLVRALLKDDELNVKEAVQEEWNRRMTKMAATNDGGIGPTEGNGSRVPDVKLRKEELSNVSGHHNNITVDSRTSEERSFTNKDSDPFEKRHQKSMLTTDSDYWTSATDVKENQQKTTTETNSDTLSRSRSSLQLSNGSFQNDGRQEMSTLPGGETVSKSVVSESRVVKVPSDDKTGSASSGSSIGQETRKTEKSPWRRRKPSPDGAVSTTSKETDSASEGKTNKKQQLEGQIAKDSAAKSRRSTKAPAEKEHRRRNKTPPSPDQEAGIDKGSKERTANIVKKSKDESTTNNAKKENSHTLGDSSTSKDRAPYEVKKSKDESTTKNAKKESSHALGDSSMSKERAPNKVKKSEVESATKKAKKESSHVLGDSSKGHQKSGASIQEEWHRRIASTLETELTTKIKGPSSEDKKVRVFKDLSTGNLQPSTKESTEDGHRKPHDCPKRGGASPRNGKSVQIEVSSDFSNDGSTLDYSSSEEDDDNEENDVCAEDFRLFSIWTEITELATDFGSAVKDVGAITCHACRKTDQEDKHYNGMDRSRRHHGRRKKKRHQRKDAVSARGHLFGADK